MSTQEYDQIAQKIVHTIVEACPFLFTAYYHCNQHLIIIWSFNSICHT